MTRKGLKLAAVLAMCCAGYALGLPAGSSGFRQVLAILPVDVSSPEILAGLRGAGQMLRRHSGDPISIHAEMVFPGDRLEAEIGKQIAGCGNHGLNAIIVVVPLVAATARERDRLCPEVPLIYVGGVEDSLQRPANSTGVLAPFSVRRSLPAVLRLFPQTRRLVIVGGASDEDRAGNRIIADVAKAFEPQMEIVEWNRLTLEDLKTQVAALPADSVVLLTGSVVSAGMHELSEVQVAHAVVPVSKAPVFTLHGSIADGGVVGALGALPEEVGKAVGEAILRLAKGERASEIAPVTGAPRLSLDWRALQKFGVPANRIPRDADVYFRQPGPWERYRPLIISAVVGVLAELLLIMLLLAERKGRKESQQRLAKRLAFERMTSEVSAGFADLPPDRLSDQIHNSLGRIAGFFEVERAILWRCESEENLEFEPMQAFLVPSEEVKAPTRQVFPEFYRAPLRAGEAVVIPDVAALPLGSETREWLMKIGVKCSLGVPLLVSGELRWCLTCANFSGPRRWAPETAERLRTLASLFANILALDAARRAAQEGEALNRAVLASLPGYVAILDRCGVVLRLNDAWSAAPEPAALPLEGLEIGSDYLEAARRLTLGVDSGMGLVSEAVSAVLSGERATATAGIRRTGTPEQWFEVQVEALEWPAGGAVVSHVDVSAKKRVELHDARNLATIAHMNRVAAVGELVTSLAHELNQPLGAITINAATVEMQLRRRSEPVPGALQTIADIAADAARGGEVIARMRTLSKQQINSADTDLNNLVEKAARLVRRDAGIRQVEVLVELAPGAPVVKVDSVQLLQVLLNLGANALDAMAASTRRILRYRCLTVEDQALIEVEDTGSGVPEQELESIFDAFYTTKSAGLGMGLSVSRSIVVAHGGRLWVENGREGGAIFRCSLPLAKRSS